MLQLLQNFAIKYYAFFIAVIAFFMDQIFKTLIADNVLANEKIIILNNILSFTKVYNTGAAFGIFQDKILFLSLFSIIITVIISVYLVKTGKTLDFINKISWGLILGGTVGNFIDRLYFGYVLDFIRIDFVDFPVFNIADICINIGALLLIFHLVISGQRIERSIKNN